MSLPSAIIAFGTKLDGSAIEVMSSLQAVYMAEVISCKNVIGSLTLLPTNT